MATPTTKSDRALTLEALRDEGRQSPARLGRGSHLRGPPRVAWRMLNGLPALVVDLPEAVEPDAPRLVVRGDVDRGGRIVALHLVLAPEKLRTLEEWRRS